ARSAGRRPVDGVLRERHDRSRAADEGAVPAGDADEAAVLGGLPRPLPDLRREPEPRGLRLPAGVGRSPAGRAEGAQTLTFLTPRSHDAQSKTTTLEDAHGQAPDARRAPRGGAGRMPALPRAEASAPRVPQLRVLPRPPGAPGRRGLSGLPRGAAPGLFP